MPSRILMTVAIALLLLGCGRERPVNATETQSKAKAHEQPGHETEIRLTAEAVKRSGIKVEPVTRRRLVSMISAPARIQFNPEAMSIVGSPLTGRVAAFNVRLGQTVHKGDVLLVIDSPSLGDAQIEFMQKRAAVQVVGAQFELARSAFKRAKSLYDDTRGISLSEVQKREAELKAAQSNQAAADAAVSAAVSRLRVLGMDADSIQQVQRTSEVNPKLPLRVAINGVVVAINVTPGQLVSPDRESLMTVADLNRLWIIADVPESQLPEITMGAGVKISGPSLGETPIDGAVTYIAPNVDSATRTAAVRIEAAVESKRLIPGAFVQARIEAITGAGELLAVPAGAIQTIEGQPVVFAPAPGSPGSFVKRPVTIGEPVGDFVPVHAGVEVGDPIVIAGSFILKAELGKSEVEHDD